MVVTVSSEEDTPILLINQGCTNRMQNCNVWRKELFQRLIQKWIKSCCHLPWCAFLAAITKVTNYKLDLNPIIKIGLCTAVENTVCSIFINMKCHHLCLTYTIHITTPLHKWCQERSAALFRSKVWFIYISATPRAKCLLHAKPLGELKGFKLL